MDRDSSARAVSLRWHHSTPLMRSHSHPSYAMMQADGEIEAMLKGMGEQVSDPETTTLDVKPLGPRRHTEIGTLGLKLEAPPRQEVTRKYVVDLGKGWK